jgi:hypothetical protein
MLHQKKIVLPPKGLLSNVAIYCVNKSIRDKVLEKYHQKNTAKKNMILFWKKGSTRGPWLPPLHLNIK